jgi:hypothetical protein
MRELGGDKSRGVNFNVLPFLDETLLVKLTKLGEMDVERVTPLPTARKYDRKYLNHFDSSDTNDLHENLAKS